MGKGRKEGWRKGEREEEGYVEDLGEQEAGQVVGRMLACLEGMMGEMGRSGEGDGLDGN